MQQREIMATNQVAISHVSSLLCYSIFDIQVYHTHTHRPFVNLEAHNAENRSQSVSIMML